MQEKVNGVYQPLYPQTYWQQVIGADNQIATVNNRISTVQSNLQGQINQKQDASTAVTISNIYNYAPHFAYGTYTGNGDAIQTIDLPFTPIAVFVTQVDGVYFRESDPLVMIDNRIQTWYGGLAVKGSPLQAKFDSPSRTFTLLTVRQNGFDVANGDEQGRVAGKTVNYSFRLNPDYQIRKYIAWG
nr:MAG TPA: hypothetical protein [Bacteriophage sp.]